MTMMMMMMRAMKKKSKRTLSSASSAVTPRACHRSYDHPRSSPLPCFQPSLHLLNLHRPTSPLASDCDEEEAIRKTFRTNVLYFRCGSSDTAPVEHANDGPNCLNASICMQRPTFDSLLSSRIVRSLGFLCLCSLSLSLSLSLV
jgi:hypothetical protein